MLGISLLIRRLFQSEDVSSDDFLCSKCFDRITTMIVSEQGEASHGADFASVVEELHTLNQSTTELKLKPRNMLHFWSHEECVEVQTRQYYYASMHMKNSPGCLLSSVRT
ncbi:uncharacterized protein LOC126412276 [Schistocerca serialis cubense]|uniref:uncharacterized protein LOC126412276 n=1 Tax=Schistocerca serialis cubense TaxID=2023355 RepID=UPI00214ED329|nr:uncharacterized protein LOC126412276 [Schistocerca serialis cubense]XP_049937752.1 uncharacterized protein LOC126412276 [Schistocerca serialis cubense]